MQNHEPIVIALGGNALQRKKEASAEAQQSVARDTAERLAALVQNGHRLIIVHGNGPQVGNIVLHEEAINTPDVPTLPLDSCVAMSQGSIGYWLQQALINEFTKQSMHSTAATLVTQIIVDPNDTAFSSPSKPIGPFYADETEARQAASERQFTVKEDAGRGWRRVVPSPRPLSIVESYSLEQMVAAGVTVITGGGGGVPVVREENGTYRGVEAVIDKDFTAAVIADAVGASRLIILTAVEYVMTGFGTEHAVQLHTVSSHELDSFINKGEFAAGSMLPKIKAAQMFLTKPNRLVSIGSLDHVDEVIAELSGTHIRP